MKPTTYEPSSQTAKPTLLNNSSKCESTSGYFGKVTSDSIAVVYNYMMELSHSTPEVTLPKLEVEITNTLVYSFIASCAANSSIIYHNFSNAATSQVLGISSFPPDIVQSGE
jgi:hypothetical protein